MLGPTDLDLWVGCLVLVRTKSSSLFSTMMILLCEETLSQIGCWSGGRLGSLQSQHTSISLAVQAKMVCPLLTTNLFAQFRQTAAKRAEIFRHLEVAQMLLNTKHD